MSSTSIRLSVDSTSSVTGDAINGSGGADNDGLAQTFGVSTGFDLTKLDLKLNRDVSTTGGTLFVEIWATDSESKPTGSPLTSGSRSVNGLMQSESFQTIELTQFTLTANTTYAIVAYRDDSNPTQDVNWRTRTTGDIFSVVGGSWLAWDAVAEGNRGSWSLFSGDTDNDRLFQLFGVDTPSTNAPTFHTPQIIVDWNNDGTFSSTEAIDDWIIAVDWNRGKEPEQDNTPTGTAIVKVRDTSGSFVPDSTFWGDGNVEINREIRARTVYQNTTYALFRGRLHRIMPQLRPGNDQLAILFVTDETEVFKNNIVSAPNSALTTGGASPDGDDPREDGTFGGASGIIADILDETSFASGRRELTETGSTAEVWWTFQTDAKSALNKVEEHEGKKSSIFINSSGTLTFHSSTHREGSTYVTGFGPGSTGPLFQLIEGYELSARDIVNSVDVTIFTRTTKASSVQEIPEPNVTITQGSAYTWIVPLDNAPVGSVTVPLAERDSTAGMSIRGVGGTTYTSDSHDAMVQATILGGGSAIEFTVTNPGSTQGISESIQVHNPAAAGFEGDTDAFPLIVALHDISRVTDSITNGVSISRYGRRAASFEFDFFGSLDTGPNTAKATNRSSAEIANNSTAHANGVRLHLTGSDSDSITQILTRELNDRIRLELPALSLTNKDFYITKGEWTLGEGGIFNVIWTLQEAT